MKSRNELSTLVKKIIEENLLKEDSFNEKLPHNFIYYQLKTNNLNTPLEIGKLSISSLRLMIKNSFESSGAVESEDDSVLLIKFTNHSYRRFSLNKENFLAL